MIEILFHQPLRRARIKDTPSELAEQEPSGPSPADTAEYLAQKTLEGIESGEPEIFPPRLDEENGTP